MGLVWTLALLLSGLAVGASGAKPEHIENLRVLAESAELNRQNERTRHSAYCGIERLQVLGPHAQEHEVMSLAILGCMDKIPEKQCRSNAAEMWSSRNMTSDFTSSSNFCEVLRAFIQAPSLEAAPRRRFWSRRRSRRRSPTTKYYFGKSGAKECDSEGKTVSTEAECREAVRTMKKDFGKQFYHGGNTRKRSWAPRGCFTADKRIFDVNPWGDGKWWYEEATGRHHYLDPRKGTYPICRNKNF